MALSTRPDVLVLGAGGTLGEAWTQGLLAGIEDATGFDLRQTESIVGTSAGSIVAACLAGGLRPRRPQTADPAALGTGAQGGLQPAGRGRAQLLGPFAAPLLRLERRPGAIARGMFLRALPAGTRSLARLERNIDRSEARFDGRLRIVCVERRSGTRVVFGAPGAYPAAVGRAVAASCAIPGWFEPVQIGDREYVDGGVWSATNLDVAPAGRDTHVLCVVPMEGLQGSLQSALGLVRAALRSRLVVELASMRARGAHVTVVGPDAAAGGLMSPNLMDPGPSARVLAAGYAQGHAIGV